MAIIGQVLQGRYRIELLLGQGGMGAVYRAWDARLDIPVAIKEMVPPPGLDARALSGLREQFRREARVLARLSHPHLVRVIDHFEEGGNAYLVMDFVEGVSLADLIRQRGPLPEGQVLAWAAQLLDALAYCHSQGVIHRDVKPQNVIIRGDGRAVLVDFGLVKLWDPQDPRTRTAVHGMGTPEYAPPEQYSRTFGYTDPRSDLYSLGATLYHALTGQAPMTATDRMAMPERFRPVRALTPGVSPRTEAAVMRAMELPVNARFGSAAEMRAALLGGGTVRPVASTPPGGRPILPAAAPPSHLLPAWVWMGVAGIGVLLLTLFGFLALNRPRPAPPSPIPSPTATPTPTRVRIVQPTVPSPTPAPAPTFTPTPTPVLLTLTGPAEGAWFAFGASVTLAWSGPALTDRQRFVVEVAGRELELRGPQPGPEFRYALPFRLPEGDYTWRVRLEEEREGRWEVLARSGEGHFRVLPPPKPTDTPTPSPTPTTPTQEEIPTEAPPPTPTPAREG